MATQSKLFTCYARAGRIVGAHAGNLVVGGVRVAKIVQDVARSFPGHDFEDFVQELGRTVASLMTSNGEQESPFILLAAFVNKRRSGFRIYHVHALRELINGNVWEWTAAHQHVGMQRMIGCAAPAIDAYADRELNGMSTISPQELRTAAGRIVQRAIDISPTLKCCHCEGPKESLLLLRRRAASRWL